MHLLVRVPPSLAPATLVKRAKGSSSHAVNHATGIYRTFRWQGGYGAFSISRRHVPIVSNYILRQEEHHRDQRLWTPFEPASEPAAPEMSD